MQFAFGHDEEYWTCGSINGAKGWAYYWWAREHEERIWGSGEKRTRCYVRQERDRVMKHAR